MHQPREEPGDLTRALPRALFIFKASFSTLTFTPTPPWEVPTITTPISRSRGSRARAKLGGAMPKRGEEAARLAWCWLRHRGESRRRGSAGTCQTQPLPLPGPPGPALARRGTAPIAAAGSWLLGTTAPC